LAISLAINTCSSAPPSSSVKAPGTIIYETPISARQLPIAAEIIFDAFY